MATDDRRSEAIEEQEAPPEARLGRLQAKRKVLGKWVGYVALGVTLLSIAATQLFGPVPAAAMCAVAVFVGIKALDSRGRGVAFLSIFLAGLLLMMNLAFIFFFHDIGFHAPPPPS